MKVFIIGPGGYIGKKLSSAHIEVGDEVYFSSSKDKTGINSELGIFSSSFEMPQHTDVVYFLAQSPFYRQVPEKSAHLISVNCVAALQAAEACRKAGVKTFIYASTGNVYKASYATLNENSPLQKNDWYALSKVMAEDALNLYRPHMNVVVARIFGVYGPAQNDKLVPSLIQRVKSHAPILLDRSAVSSMDLDGLKISLIYIDDAVKCFLEISRLISPPPIINIASSEALSIREIVEHISERLSIPASFSISDRVRKSNLIADVSLLTSLLGDKFTSFSDGIKDTLSEG